MAERFRALDLKFILGLFSVVPSSTPRPRRVNNQLVSLLPVGILNYLCLFTIFVCLFTASSISTDMLSVDVFSLDRLIEDTNTN